MKYYSFQRYDAIFFQSTKKKCNVIVGLINQQNRKSCKSLTKTQQRTYKKKCGTCFYIRQKN